MPSTYFDDSLFPRRLVREPGAACAVGCLLRAAGVPAGRVTMVADRVIHDLGRTDRVLSSPRESGFEAHVFADVAGEPDEEPVARAVEVGSGSDPRAVVGIGGGSAFDTAKIVALFDLSWAKLVRTQAPVEVVCAGG